MIRILLRYLLAGVPAPPPVPRLLWATLGLLTLATLQLGFAHEVWARPTTATRWWSELAIALSVLALWPQLLAWSWRWLRAYAGPGWLRLLATAGYLAGAVGGSLLVVISGGYCLLWLLALLPGDPGGW